MAKWYLKVNHVFCVEYFLNSDDDFFDYSEDEILEKTYIECLSIDLFNKKDLDHFLVLKLKMRMPL